MTTATNVKRYENLDKAKDRVPLVTRICESKTKGRNQEENTSCLFAAKGKPRPVNPLWMFCRRTKRPRA